MQPVLAAGRQSSCPADARAYCLCRKACLERHSPPDLLVPAEAIEGLARAGARDQAAGADVRKHAQHQLIAQECQASQPCRQKQIVEEYTVAFLPLLEH